jgi:predicted extracellular nuclease
LANDKINVAFWNLGNLFDTKSSTISSHLEFTPQRGWDDTAKEKKLENLAKTINSLHNNQGPDLLGLCEIENEEMAQALINKMGKQDVYSIAQYINSPDIRGIDTCLIYSKDKFKFNYAKGYNIFFRYPTRDIFLANLTTL